jgi:ribosomal protein L17
MEAYNIALSIVKEGKIDFTNWKAKEFIKEVDKLGNVITGGEVDKLIALENGFMKYLSDSQTEGEIDNFIKTPSVGDKIKVYKGVDGVAGCYFAVCKGVSRDNVIEKGKKKSKEFIFIERVDYEHNFREIDFFLTEARVRDINA